MNNNRGLQKKAVIFDRDGTLIEDKVYLNDPDAIVYFEGAFEALRMLRDQGYIFFVATNQSGVPRGLVQIPNLLEIHRRIKNSFAGHGVDILEFYYAPYPTESNHIYRKPNPGMLLQAAREYNLDLAKSWMVGDRGVDVEAGHRAGARSILIDRKAQHKGGISVEHYDAHCSFPEAICTNLIEVASFIAQHGEDDR